MISIAKRSMKFLRSIKFPQNVTFMNSSLLIQSIKACEAEQVSQNQICKLNNKLRLYVLRNNFPTKLV